MVFPARKSQTLTHPLPRIMRLRPFGFSIQLFLLAILSVFTSLAAQTTTTPAVNLDQLDNTYSTNLRKYHAPVIQDYLRELNKLKQTMVGRNRNMDAALVQTEIDKVKKLSNTTGLLPYDSLNALSSGHSSEDAPRKKNDTAIVLAAGSETRSSPDRSTLKLKPTGKALPIGAAEWMVEKITPGSYRVAVQYTCPNTPEGIVISAKIGTASVQRKLTSEDTTSDINEFRFTKLGYITIDQELTKEPIVLQNLDPTNAAIWVRQIILTKVKEP